MPCKHLHRQHRHEHNSQPSIHTGDSTQIQSPSNTLLWMAGCGSSHSHRLTAMTPQPGLDVECLVAEFHKLTALWRLGETVGQHVLGWTAFNACFLRFHSTGNEEAPDVDMPGSFTTGSLSILLQQHGTLIVLVHCCVIHLASLFFEEASCPQHHGHCVAHPNRLGLRGAARVEFQSG